MRLRPHGRRPAGLKNVGPVSARWLAAVGIHKRADLIRLGPIEAFLRVKAAGHKPSLNLLWALAGAERGLQWSRLSDDDRRQLLMQLDAAQAQRDGAPAPSPGAARKRGKPPLKP